MCRLFGLSESLAWKDKCSNSVNNNRKVSNTKKFYGEFEINCDVLCRIGQGGKACLCA